MKGHLIDILQDIVDLLIACGLYDRALWFVERLNRVKRLDVASPDLQVLLKEIDDIMWGAGSFSDLSLVPKDKKIVSELTTHCNNTTYKHIFLADVSIF